MAISNGKQCSECGYELAGLGEHGECPECGNPYDITSGLGVSTSKTRKHDRGAKVAARLRTVMLFLLMLGILACGGLMSLVATNPMRPIAIAVLFAVVTALATITSFLYENPS